MYSKENSFQKFQLKFEGDPTVGSKVMDLPNRYSRLEGRDLRLIEYRFHMYSKKSGFRKLL
jgi:hypothetical protein